jgi:uncharacterized repeat protein (TIGR01451 family)
MVGLNACSAGKVARCFDGVAMVKLLFALIAASILFAPTAQAQVVTQYTNTTTAPIVDNNCTTALISRTFNVPTTYIVGDVDLGVMLTHTYRSDLRITLQSPAGTTVNVMLNVAGSGDNLHDRFDDEAAANISTHNATVTDPTTPTAPPYSHSFQPTVPLSVFDGQNAAGNWTMTLCDSVGVDVGIFNRADLFITSTSLSIAKTSSVVSDTVSAANPKSVPGATVKYCILVTNNGGATQTNIVVGDPIPATATLVAGTLFTGTTCATATTAEDVDAAGADESDPFGMSVSGSTIAGATPSLLAGATFAMVFNVTIN